MKTSTKSILLLLYAFLFVLLVFSSFVFYSVSKYSHDNFYKLLEVKAYTLAQIKHEQSTGQTQSEGLGSLKTTYFDLLPSKQQFVIPELELESFILNENEVNLPQTFFETLQTEGRARHQIKNLFLKGVKLTIQENIYYAIAGAENEYEINQTAFLRRTLFFAILISMSFALFIAFYFSSYILKPIKTITSKVKDISSENLHLRLEVNNKNDEVHELSNTFNDMLDRIETSFETQNNFISNASHELRTPLTAIIGEADVTLSKPRTEQEYVEALKVIINEAEKLESKTRALLFLAQTGFNGVAQKFDKVRVDQLLFDVKKTVEGINPKAKIFINTELLPDNPLSLKVKGSEQLLHLAFSNLISNGCKYSDNQLVNISIGVTDKEILVIITDRGIGIPQAEIKYIYDPFFRASNTRNYEGYGIGLPLTQNIIRMHRGSIKVDSTEKKGTQVEVRLPIGQFNLG